MALTYRLVLAWGALALISLTTPALAQVSLEKIRQELIAPWLMTVQGEPRSRILRINEVSQDTEGSFLINAVFGWIDGEASIVRIELIQSAQQRRLVVRTVPGAMISVLQAPDGSFAGTFKTSQGAEAPVRMERVVEEQLPQLTKESQARMAARTFADEDKDWGVAPTKSPRTGRMHAPTPKELPGARTITAMQLRALQDQSPAPILIDVLDGDGHRTIPGARWLREAGKAAFGRAEAEGLQFDLEKLTAGRKSAPVVFFCLSSECWLSYNAGLRAVEMGYTNVHWFRGGTEAWRRAGFATREAEPYRR